MRHVSKIIIVKTIVQYASLCRLFRFTSATCKRRIQRIRYLILANFQFIKMVKQVFSLFLVFGIVSLCYGYSDCGYWCSKAGQINLSHRFICLGSTTGELVKLTVSSCSNLDKRCILPRNTNATLTMEFNLKYDASNVTSVVHGIVLGVPIPFALPNPNGCVDSGLICPLKAGGPYTYIASLPVEKKYPKVTVDVKWELKNENSNNILCVEIPAKIQ